MTLDKIICLILTLGCIFTTDKAANLSINPRQRLNLFCATLFTLKYCFYQSKCEGYWHKKTDLSPSVMCLFIPQGGKMKLHREICLGSRSRHTHIPDCSPSHLNSSKATNDYLIRLLSQLSQTPTA